MASKRRRAGARSKAHITNAVFIAVKKNWRAGRVAEGAPLLRVYMGNRIEGSLFPDKISIGEKVLGSEKPRSPII